MSRPTSNLRLFVAVYPPADLVRAMLERVKALPLPPRTRLTPPDQLHMTLQFIGDTPVAEMDDVQESVRRAAAGLPAFALALRELIALPERGHSRLIAAETDAPSALLELQRRLAQRLARNPRNRGRTGDRFRPHITLCRFALPVKRFDLGDAALTGSFMVDRIALMRATLSSAGATHHQVLAVALE
ncbi:MAG TPA: RNA 2',3'-cyclic phosphodiesterase [Phycisphaerales bacterium]|nr:RNA 2',3'-cyclic phosphodiesterase [Phycisphaerales bacterium]